ncbi:MAG TPA: hypothetical protein PLP14_10110, partial [Chitinophagaceae bacterium]|nr:hypothetical protein [Chitinophagaceae bacterium]
ATYATTALTNGQVVTCVLTSNANCASPATATSNGITMTVTACSVSLNLKAYLEGYYISGGLMNKTLYFEGVDPNPVSTLVDTITVLLRNPTAPYTVAGTYKGIIQTNGTITCTFPPSLLGNSYYIVVTHRNTLTTWSANPVLMSASTIYDFTTAASKAYGNNQVQVGPSIWAMYTGDVVSDENVDLLDIGTIQNDIVLFGFGYLATDINGDGNVDLLDQPLVENNVSNFIFSDHP